MDDTNDLFSLGGGDDTPRSPAAAPAPKAQAETPPKPAAKPAKPSTSSEYGADSIVVLEGLEPVRKRPGMYIGGTDDKAMHHLFAEVIDNSMDEAVAGHASWIEVELDKDGLWMWDKNLVRLEVRNKFYAIGTGAQYAMGAMEAGATPAEAVKISARYDEHTGLPIETMKLEG